MESEAKTSIHAENSPARRFRFGSKKVDSAFSFVGLLVLQASMHCRAVAAI